jgi:hypothetical protein
MSTIQSAQLPRPPELVVELLFPPLPGACTVTATVWINDPPAVSLIQTLAVKVAAVA